MLRSRHTIVSKSTNSDNLSPVPGTNRVSNKASNGGGKGLEELANVPPTQTDANANNAAYVKNKSALRALTLEFQSLKLESMSTVEDYGATSKTLASTLQKDIMFPKQYMDNSSTSLIDYNDSDSLSSSSGDERELTQTIFQEQVKFFCQMKDFLLSQQMALRQQLEALNFQVTKKRSRHYAPPRRHRLGLGIGLGQSSSSLHIPNLSTPSKVEITPSPIPHLPPDNIQQFFSCSSAEKSDLFQTCPICGVELDTQENPEALEEHVAGHWCST